MNEPWTQIAQHGDSPDDIRQRLVEMAADALKALRRDLLAQGLPARLIERALAAAWQKQLEYIDDSLPKMLADMERTAGDNLPMLK